MPKIFNPLDALASKRAAEQDQTVQASDQIATAAIYNETVGECPKCKKKMVTGVIANSDSVFFCQVCRVAAPFADQ